MRFNVQVILSTVMLGYCLATVTLRQGDTSAYWSTATSILAYWLPAPSKED